MDGVASEHSAKSIQERLSLRESGQTGEREIEGSDAIALLKGIRSIVGNIAKDAK